MMPRAVLHCNSKVTLHSPAVLSTCPTACNTHGLDTPSADRRLGLFPLSLCYVGYGLMNEATNLLRRRHGTGEEQHGEKVAHQESEAHFPK